MIYLDYQATTPVAPEVAKAMLPWIEERFANPHSASRWGSEAAAAVEVARKRIEEAIGLKGGGLAFTSSATEAINWALKGTAEKAEEEKSGRNRIITVATEHAAVLDTCEWLAAKGWDLTILPVEPDGRLDLELLARELDERVLLVAVMQVNNEIGVTQPISEISSMAHEAGALMLCDAVQAFGKVEICKGPDLVAVSAHKIYGPKGIGGLWMRKGREPSTLIHGGGQERGLRSGTLSPALCVGFGAAARLADERQTRDYDHVQKLWNAALHALGPGWTINGSTTHRYHGNLNIRREGVDGARLIADLRDIAFSLGSACASGSGRPSHVLRALGLDYRQSRSSLRLGFGRYTTQKELIDACHRISAHAKAQEKLDA
ncbi:MAG TPA: cysteine desulfurase family protein [Sphingomicrobium sp.]|jgi:cysteine desulfurase|nr:cysteine desulfurase family protein [Sphingomicrobium sp.]